MVNIPGISNSGSSATITKITISVDRKFAHYLFWERQEFGFIAEDVGEIKVLMHFECEVHPTSFVRWFMKFSDFSEIMEPACLQVELAEIILAAAAKINFL